MPASSPRLILASRSPRRRDLLAQLGVTVTVRPADIDETPRVDEDPVGYVERMATEKAMAVDLPDSACALAADTVVLLDGDVLGKPETRERAQQTLGRLSGRTHSVHTAVALRSDNALHLVRVETRVSFRSLSSSECDCYLDSGEAWDKAGAYAIQGLGGAFVERIEGSYSNVVGLPLSETLALLRQAGIATGLDPQKGVAEA